MIEQLQFLQIPLLQLQQLQHLHFLRPLWLLSVVPALALAFAWWRNPGSGANWRRAIAPDLLEHLLETRVEHRQRWPWLLLLGWILAALAMAGPTWEKLPQPVLQKRDALVIVLDLSLSMYAEDIKPSRLQRARFKIIDILKRRAEGLTGLVAYSGDAHVVAPLTDDTATIANLVPALAPDMMPSYGSDPVAGVEQAIQLLRNAGFERGRILLLSDEITDANIEAIGKLVDGGHWQLSIMGIGTEQGAPIPLGNGDKNNEGRNAGFLKQRNGDIVVAQLHRSRFEELAQRSGGRYSDLRVDDKDLDTLLPATQPGADETRAVQREFDQWRERGVWLVMLLLPFAALIFRRGWLLLLLILPLSPPSDAQALKAGPQQEPQAAASANSTVNWQHEWRNLWQRPDQQGQQALNAGDAKTAAQEFRDPAWRGAAQYRAADYAAAAQTLQNVDAADADYNRGNALARAGQLSDALAAYDAALKKNPNLDDAKANRELVEKLLQQQKQQQKNNPSDKNKDQDDKSAQNSGSQDSQQSSSQQSSSQQQSSQQQGGDKNQQPENGSDKKQQAQSGADQDKSSADSKAQQHADASAQQSTAEKKEAAEQAAKQRDGASQQNADAAKEPGKAAQQTAAAEESKEQLQQQRATEQWLRQIPDDPAGLLRRKFLYEHRQRERAPARDNEQPLW
ncbi:MAG TPA: VWA domain-containing protein [Spongiibacteraceae bacterium]|nr:VWA domain-containing protein [Spongiibacteraceae bacterium]